VLRPGIAPRHKLHNAQCQVPRGTSGACLEVCGQMCCTPPASSRGKGRVWPVPEVEHRQLVQRPSRDCATGSLQTRALQGRQAIQAESAVTTATNHKLIEAGQAGGHCSCCPCSSIPQLSLQSPMPLRWTRSSALQRGSSRVSKLRTQVLPLTAKVRCWGSKRQTLWLTMNPR
jgi:hypothetical protein